MSECKNALRSDLELCIEQFNTFVSELAPFTDQEHKTKLCDMYNIEPTTHNNSGMESMGDSLQDLEQLAQKMHLIRRECVTQLLALDIMADGKRSMRTGYVETWASVTDILQEMLIAATANVKEISKISSPEPSKHASSYVYRHQ